MAQHPDHPAVCCRPRDPEGVQFPPQGADVLRISLHLRAKSSCALGEVDDLRITSVLHTSVFDVYGPQLKSAPPPVPPPATQSSLLEKCRMSPGRSRMGHCLLYENEVGMADTWELCHTR